MVELERIPVSSNQVKSIKGYSILILLIHWKANSKHSNGCKASRSIVDRMSYFFIFRFIDPKCQNQVGSHLRLTNGAKLSFSFWKDLTLKSLVKTSQNKSHAVEPRNLSFNIDTLLPLMRCFVSSGASSITVNFSKTASTTIEKTKVEPQH
ncbi:uncharacterized protein DS421_10g305170 [Arachis hypogaea]|nr:uncharacterized protein DS421_10g305170 [Arachis hypogaea]